jgi:serpin B
MSLNPSIRYALATAVISLIVIAAWFGLAVNKAPGTQTGGSEIEGIYFVKSNLERETSPQVPQEDIAKLIDGNSSFAFDLYQNIRSGTGNLFFSPYSISMALAMTYAGARGETAQQMAEALDFTLSQENLHPAFNALDLTLVDNGNDNFRLNIANSLWGQYGFSFENDFLDVLALNYGARMWLVDFITDAENARTKINYWVSEHTENRIDNLLPPGSVDDYTRLVLTNAIYFKATWQNKFDEQDTKEETFTRLDNSQVTVPMMFQSERLRYAAGTGYQAVELPYKDADASMIIILPTLDNFNEFESSLDSELVGAIENGLQYQEVDLKMPKFEFEASLGLSDALKQMGMTAAFSLPPADFTGISGENNLYITDVLHKGFVSVDENGTEAAAATAVIVGTLSLPPPPTPMTIDHPFIFMIRHNNGSILFLGRVLDPTA